MFQNKNDRGLKKGIIKIAIQLISVNLLFVFLLYLSTIFVDWKEVRGEVSYFNSGQGLWIPIVIFQVLVVAFLIINWYRQHRRFNPSINELLEEGENEFVEFKSYLRWDPHFKKTNKDLGYLISKAIVGFLNTNGGVVLIGVEDDGNIIGLENDYQTFKNETRDSFMLHLSHIINDYIGKEFSDFISFHIEEIDNKDICRINITPADQPAFLKYKKQEEFCVRSGSSTRSMTIKQAHQYIEHHWMGVKKKSR